LVDYWGFVADLARDLDRILGTTDTDRFAFASLVSCFLAAFWSRLRRVDFTGLLLFDLDAAIAGFTAFLDTSFFLATVTLLCGFFTLGAAIFLDFEFEAFLAGAA
jgi:hypothetical protein